MGEGGFLRRAIAADRVPSLIFWGPPGTGKTTLARIIATVTSSHFVPFSAVTSGIKEVKEVMAEAVRLRKAQGRRTLLFVDEIHRFNRAQQDAFLPYVESGRRGAGGGHDREPLLRAQRGAPLPLPGDRAGAAPPRGPGRHDAPGPRRSRAGAGGVRRRGGRRGARGAGAARLGGCPEGPESPGAGGRPTRRGVDGSMPRPCAGSPSARCCSTTSRGRSTTT